jgi:HSP20 family protein
MKEERKRHGRREDDGAAYFSLPDIDPFRISKMAARHARSIIGGIGMGLGRPAIDIIDEGPTLTVRADLPGVDKKDIKINLTKDYMTIKADSSSQKEQKGEGYYYRERSAGSFYRVIRLPVEVLADSANAKYENGILSIGMKKKDYSKGKEIKIE